MKSKRLTKSFINLTFFILIKLAKLLYLTDNTGTSINLITFAEPNVTGVMV